MLEFFTNPVLRAPTIGCMLMCFSSGLIGCLVFLRKKSLVGEAISHAVYPGVVLGIMFAAIFFPFSEQMIGFTILFGAFVSGLFGQFVIEQMEKHLKISSDAALCFVLSVFFGIGVLLVSKLQMTHGLWIRQIQIFLFGQAATMVDTHIYLYGFLALITVFLMIVLFRFIEILYFDPDYAKVINLPIKILNGIIQSLLVLAIVIGMRSVGVVLMSSMLIAPPVAARQWTRKLSSFFLLSSFFGMASGFLGNAFSILIPIWMKQPQLTLPTGPMIVLSATMLCLFSLFFAPQKGYFIRIARVTRFRLRCKQENLLKDLYKKNPYQYNAWLFWRMKMKGWVNNSELTPLGREEAENLIRLHRLWEVYLVHMGQEAARVHHNAEQMEHILTPEIEKQLQHLLNHPETDPHEQPIPKGGKL